MLRSRFARRTAAALLAAALAAGGVVVADAPEAPTEQAGTTWS